MIIDCLSKNKGNIVVGTTGNITHAGDKIYYIERKNINSIYKGESILEILKRCYFNLLNYRDSLYAKYVNVIFRREQIYDISAENF